MSREGTEAAGAGFLQSTAGQVAGSCHDSVIPKSTTGSDVAGLQPGQSFRTLPL
jgi:hypothetical protein